MTLIIGIWLWCRTLWIKITKPGRRHRMRQAKDIIKKLHAIPNDGAVITYLRKINPYVFEELVLECLSAGGWLVWRTPSYSGDGGIDGKVYAPGIGWFYIQSKRYSQTIQPAHVEHFIAKVGRKNGLFVHTGRTGETSRSYIDMQPSSRVLIISGALLIVLIRTPTRLTAALTKKYS